MTTRTTDWGAIGWVVVLLIVLAFAALALAQPNVAYEPALGTFGDAGLWTYIDGGPFIPAPY